MKGLQALFNQDNGTGRVQSLSSSGLSDIGRHLKSWYAKLPTFYTDSMSPNVVSWSFNDVPTGQSRAARTARCSPATARRRSAWAR